MTSFILTTGINNFAGTASTTDAFIATAFGTLTGADTLSGGAGFGDVLILTGAPGAYLASHFAGVSGIEYIQTVNASLILPDSIAATAETRQIFVESGGGSTIDASAFGATSGLSFAADPGATGFNVTGGAGADIFQFSSIFAAADTFNGGGGTDFFALNAFAATTFLIGANVANIERFSLTGAASATFGAGFSAPGGIAVVSTDAGIHAVTAAAGATVRLDAEGGSGTDSFISLAAGNQADIFRFAAINLTAADTLRGGSGTGDVLALSSSSGVNTVSAADLAGVREIETIGLTGSNGSGVRIELPRSILVGVAGSAIAVNGSADGDMIDASAFAAGERLLASGLGGDDDIEGGAGADTLNGGAGGADTLSYRNSAAAVIIDLGLGAAGGVGSAAVGDGISDFENVRGSAFADMLTGGAGANGLFGLEGNDTLIGAAGADRLEGGAGNDTYGVDSALDMVVEALGAGYDTVNTALLSYTLGADVERVNYTGLGNFTGKGNVLANRLNGNAGSDRFLVDAGGADIFSGGAGSDSLDFRAGAVAAVLNFATDIHGGAALGDIIASVEKFFGSNTAGDTMTAGAGRADFSGFGGNDTLTGGISVDKLSGGDGADTLDGGANDDSIQGGKNNDTLTGGTGRDYFLYVETAASGGWGADTVADFQDGLDLIKIDAPGVASSIAGFTIAGNGTASVTLTLAAAPANTITLNAAAPITITAADFLFY